MTKEQEHHIWNEYGTEMMEAKDWIDKHQNDDKTKKFLYLMNQSTMIHSDLWSQIYDYFAENYDANDRPNITGMTYLMEVL